MNAKKCKAIRRHMRQSGYAWNQSSGATGVSSLTRQIGTLTLSKRCGRSLYKEMKHGVKISGLCPYYTAKGAA